MTLTKVYFCKSYKHMAQLYPLRSEAIGLRDQFLTEAVTECDIHAKCALIIVATLLDLHIEFGNDFEAAFNEHFDRMLAFAWNVDEKALRRN